jgi:hypothetical protein
VSLDSQMVRVSISECLPFRAKVVDVLFGPFNLSIPPAEPGA